MESLFGNKFQSMSCTFDSCLSPLTLTHSLSYASCMENTKERAWDNIMRLVTLRRLGNSREPQETLALKNTLYIVCGMYTKTNRRVRVDDTLADEIQVNPELHQMSILTTLLIHYSLFCFNSCTLNVCGGYSSRILL